MSNDASTSSTTTSSKPPGKTATKPSSKADPKKAGTSDRDDSGSGPTTLDTAVASAPAGERAKEMRAGLAVRREAESLLAQASELRQSAAADADTMVTDAEALAAELLADARAESERLVAAAQERADGIVARARAEADELNDQIRRERDQVRAQVAQAVRADVDHAHAGLQSVSPVLEDAITAVGDALASLAVLRGEDWTPPAAIEASEPVEAEPVVAVPAAPAEEIEVVDPREDAPVSLPASGAPGAGDDTRPLGWLFRSSQP
ncbi:MAG: hypothetical protein WBP61_10830 [Nocardioides sp.]